MSTNPAYARLEQAILAAEGRPFSFDILEEDPDGEDGVYVYYLDECEVELEF